MAQTGFKIDGQNVMEGSSPWKQDYAKRCLQAEMQFNALRASMMAQLKLQMDNLKHAIYHEQYHAPYVSQDKIFELNVRHALAEDEFKKHEQSTYKKSLALRIEGWLGKQFNR